MSGGPIRSCLRCGKQREVNYDRPNYCASCRDDHLRPIANWMEHGSCREPHYDPDWWWPDTSNLDDDQTVIALNICRSCPVRQNCLNYAVDHKERHGIWGGLLPTARTAFAATMRKAV